MEDYESPGDRFYRPGEPRYIEFEPWPDTGLFGWIKRVRRKRLVAQGKAHS